MKINEVSNIQGIKNYQKMNQKDMEIKQSGLKKDEISISSEAKALLEKTKDTTSPERIKELKEQINNGTYQVDSKMVAEKMIDWLKG